MGRWLDRVVVLGGLAAVAGCIEVAPRSSVPFQDARARQARYAAEMTLAVKEERRDAVSEAAVNGRLVLPQMPEIWGVAQAQLAGPAAAAPALAPLDPPTGARPAVARSRAGRLRRPPGDCERPLPIAGLAPALLLGRLDRARGGARRGGPRVTPSPYRFDLYFDLDSSAIDAAAQRVLEGAVGSALMVRPARIIVAGHADRAGGDGYNQRLAQRRAAAVVGALIRAGVPAALIETTRARRAGAGGRPPPTASRTGTTGGSRSPSI